MKRKARGWDGVHWEAFLLGDRLNTMSLALVRTRMGDVAHRYRTKLSGFTSPFASVLVYMTADSASCSGHDAV
jgi:hypothetical protein